MVSVVLPAIPAELRIRVRDEKNQPVWTRLEVRGPDGKCLQPKDALRDRSARNRPGGLPFYIESFIVHGEATLDAPPGRYTVVAEHGPEYERAERVAAVASEPVRLDIQLKPWIRMRDRGWWSGDMHLHRPLEDAPSVALAEDFNVGVLTTMWNKRSFWSERGLPRETVVQAAPNHLLTLMNAEDERGGGAWMLHQIPEPLPLAVEGRWYPPGITFVRQALAHRRGDSLLPWFDCEKPIWWEVPVMMALAPPDSFGVLHNHFNQYGIHDSVAWGRPYDAKRYPGVRGFVDYSLGLYYRYLNLGFRLPPSAGSASGVLPNPAGYNRMYANLAGPLTIEKWYRAVKEGRTFVTNGPMLFFDAMAEGPELRGSLEVLAREPIERVEIVANGAVLRSFTPDAGARAFRTKFAVPLKGNTWAAARCFVKAENTVRLAHSAPVYLAGKWNAKEDASYFVDWIGELIKISMEDPKRFASDAEMQEVLSLYRKARDFYAVR
jgi:hypothetical protein